jgi:Holliday junction resolvasome RuvABC ATP-dependent DNA helicase subunit
MNRYYYSVKEMNVIGGPRTEAELRQMLEKGFLNEKTEVQIEGNTAWEPIFSALQNNQETGPEMVATLPTPRPKLPQLATDIENKLLQALDEQFIRGPNAFIWPKIPADKLSAGKASIVKLQRDEIVLALFDTTIFAKNMKNGIALTTRGIYWRELWSEQEALPYADIVGPLGCTEDNNLTLDDETEITCLADTPTVAIVSFLQKAAKAYGSRVNKDGDVETDREDDFDELLRPYLEQLNKLVGLRGVKQDIARLTNLVKSNLMRRKQGLKTSDTSLHMVFQGRPGTGKTTVARLIGRMYRALGVLKKGHCIETDRSGLVAEYVGHTAIKTKDLVERALGSVLFIDEAYALSVEDSPNDFGQEAIDTLLKFMEDHRDDLVVIVAGYPREMQRFVSSNPGLKSRFSKHLLFEDYTPTELGCVFQSLCTASDYHVDPEGKAILESVFREAYATRDDSFGNARLVRNLFEAAVAHQADRVMALSHPSKVALQEIAAADILKASGFPALPSADIDLNTLRLSSIRQPSNSSLNGLA